MFTLGLDSEEEFNMKKGYFSVGTAALLSLGLFTSTYAADACSDAMGHSGNGMKVNVSCGNDGSCQGLGKISGTSWGLEEWYSGGGNNSMTYYSNGTFSAEWSGAGDFLARVGFQYDNNLVDHKTKHYAVDYKYTKQSQSAGYGYIGVYGWTRNPDVEYYIVVATLLFMDLFDTLGTLIGASAGAGMVDKETGKIHNLNKSLMADAIGTTVGALCGTSTVTTYVESTTGIVEGGRTGLTALTVAGLFFLALFFSPIFLIIPSAATTSALFLVGVMMLRQVVYVDFNDFSEAMPCFMTMLMMPFTASISEGIVLGLLSYVIVKVCTGRYRDVTAMMYILSVFFLLKYVAPLL